MGFLSENCKLCRMETLADLGDFTCGDADLDDFFANDSFAYYQQLLGKTYLYKLRSLEEDTIAAFTISNASIRVDDLPNARKKKIEHDIPYQKTCRNYPAVLIGRLGVNKKIHSKQVGSEIINFIKYWFVEPNNKTGCRFVLVDAYNNPFTIKFYESNGFKMMFSNEEQEKQVLNYIKNYDEKKLYDEINYLVLSFLSIDDNNKKAPKGAFLINL